MSFSNIIGCIITTFLNLMTNILDYIHRKSLMLGLDRRAKRTLKNIEGGYNGTSHEFNELVVKYWKKFGIKPKKYCYDLFCRGKKEYNPYFIPDSLWDCFILPYFNNMNFKDAYMDKTMLCRIFPKTERPKTIVRNIAGYFYEGDGDTIISRKEAERLCLMENHLIFKPSLGQQGKGISFYDKDNPVQPKIDTFFNNFRENFIVQAIVSQHSVLEKLNSASLNTVRTISFHFKNQVHILSSQLRIGASGARVDNFSSGGNACAIKEDGFLNEKCLNGKYEWIYELPNGIKFKDIQIPSYGDIIKEVKELHCKLPYFNIIGWDFAVREDGKPILIEFNVNPGQNQIGCGEPTFGDMSDEVFQDVFIEKSLNYAFKR